jgi:ATP-binding cassette, subfamily B, bacterial
VSDAQELGDLPEQEQPQPEPEPERSVTLTIGRAVDLVTAAGRPALVALFLGVALLSGILEAAVILMVIGIAAAVADGSGIVELRLGPLDGAVSDERAVLIGLALAVLLVGCALPNAWLSARMAARTLALTRARLLRGLVATSWEKQSTVVASQFQDLAAVHAYRVANLVLVLAMFATNLLGLLALVAAAFLIDVVTAGALLVVVVALALAFRPLILSIRRRSAGHVAAHHEYLEGLANVFGVLPEIRVLGVRRAAAERIDDVNRRAVLEYQRMMFRNRLLPTLYLGATAGLLLLGLAVASGQDDLELARVGAIVLFLLRALRYSQQVQGGWQAIMEQTPYVDGIERALGEWDRSADEFGGRHLDQAGRLELRDVTYVYPTGQLGIEGLSLTILPGEIVGLEGPSGAGKSTIAQLILGLRRPSQGRYLVDGVEIEQYDEVSWFSRFAYVAQEPRLIDGDIIDNVRFLRPEISDAAVTRALEDAGIDRDIAMWDSGRSRQVGSAGRELSGGQRQRLAIARALAGEPDVVVLDEPTSALDRESEEIVRSTLQALRGRVTVILIAHRESTLTVCDRIITVDRHRASERRLTS